MKFVKIPENGASWDVALCYTIATEQNQPSDVCVEVVDAISGEILGTRRLYGIIQAEIDIAPYVRNAVGAATPSSAKIALSPSARCIVVRAEGVDSPERVFYRAPLDCSTPHMLSDTNQPAVVERGDVIRLTAFAQSEVRVSASDRRVTAIENFSAINSRGMPVEIAISTSSFAGDNVPIRVKVVCDRAQTYIFDYTVVEPTSTSYRIAWYNPKGGIECYTFPRSARKSLEAELMTEIRGRAPRLRGVVARYRLVSAFEKREEMERIAMVIISPEVFECRGEECNALKLADRKITFDDHGEMRRMELIVEKEWRGGL